MQVIWLALQDAALEPARIGALEMHGTGTPLGDPIEVGAAAAVLLGHGRSGRARATVSPILALSFIITRISFFISSIHGRSGAPAPL
jgi:3-oxoacyl-(acyl-carrier-protein) synthase